MYVDQNSIENWRFQELKRGRKSTRTIRFVVFPFFRFRLFSAAQIFG